MNDGVAIVDNYTLNDLLYSTSYYNVIYILNNKKSFDLNYKFIRDKDENCIYVCTNLLNILDIVQWIQQNSIKK